MATDDLAPASVPELVELMYRAEWTGLSLALEVTEFDDYAVRARISASHRPSWASPPRAFPDGPGRSRRRAEPWRDAADEAQDEEDAADPDEDEVHPVREAVYRLLIAPGGRFREETAAGHVSAAGGEPHPPPVPPSDELLVPAWLPAGFELELAGPALMAGRRAYRVIGRQRPVGRGRRTRPGRPKLRPTHRSGSSTSRLEDIDRVDAVVDAELGILLRSEQLYRGQVVSRREITTITPDPMEAADPAQFTAPREEDDPGTGTPISGPGWERAKAAANAGASALTFAIRHAPHREPPAGSQAGGPPGFRSSRDVDWPGPPGPDDPVSAHITGLLYEAGLRRSGFDAELRTWADATMHADAFRQATRNSTLPAVGQLGDALSERATTWQRREAIRLGLPNLYRIDYIDGGVKRPKSITEASDGVHRWRIFADHATTGPALPLPAAIAWLADPSWLLDWHLSGGAEVIEDGRRGYLIRVRPRYPLADGPAQPSVPADVVVDAELGILLRLTQEHDGRPSMQQALTEVTRRPDPDPADFRVEIPARMRVVQDSGTVLDLAELSAPVQTAVHLTVKAASAAAKVGGLLGSLRQSAGKRQGPGAR